MPEARKIFLFLVFLTVLMIFSFVFLYVQLLELKNTNRMLLQSLSESRGTAPKGYRKDPYRQVAVPNTLRKRFKAIQNCYNAFLSTNPKTTAGFVELDWQIEASGKPTKPEVVRATLDSPKLQNCIIDSIEKIRFPPPPYGRPVYYVYTYNFKKTEGLQYQAP